MKEKINHATKVAQRIQIKIMEEWGFLMVLATQAVSYETRPMKTRPSSLDLFFSFLWWRWKKRYIHQFSSWILEGFKILQSRMRYKTADNRLVNGNIHEERRSAPLVFYFNHFFFKLPVLVLFLPRGLYPLFPSMAYSVCLYLRCELDPLCWSFFGEGCPAITHTQHRWAPLLSWP